MDATFPNRWIGRDDPTPWPPRSPDITTLHFFLWRYVKDKVFSTPVPDITNLKARITDAFATVTEDMLENTWREIDYRLDVLRATQWARVEVYWCVVKKHLGLYFEKKKEIYSYSTYSSFLVINICIRGKTFYSPCSSDLFSYGAVARYWPRLASFVRFLYHIQRRTTVCGTLSGIVITPSQRPLPDNTQHSQQTDIRTIGETRTRSPTKRAAADPHFRPRGHTGPVN